MRAGRKTYCTCEVNDGLAGYRGLLVIIPNLDIDNMYRSIFLATFG
jgi:hypothetical protein